MDRWHGKRTRLTGWRVALWALLFISPALPVDIVPVREVTAVTSQGMRAFGWHRTAGGAVSHERGVMA